MTRRAIIFAISALLPISGNCQDERIDRVVSRLLDSETPDLSLATPDVRDEVIRRVRGYSGDSFEQTDGKTRQYYLLLVKLGDEDATRQMVEKLRSDLLKSRDRLWLYFLSDNAHPLIVPLIAEDFFRNDGDKVIPTLVGGDVLDEIRPVSIEMCDMALSVIRRRDSFAPATQEWAKEIQEQTGSISPQRTRQIM